MSNVSAILPGRYFSHESNAVDVSAATFQHECRSTTLVLQALRIYGHKLFIF